MEENYNLVKEAAAGNAWLRSFLERINGMSYYLKLSTLNLKSLEQFAKTPLNLLTSLGISQDISEKLIINANKVLLLYNTGPISHTNSTTTGDSVFSESTIPSSNFASPSLGTIFVNTNMQNTVDYGINTRILSAID